MKNIKTRTVSLCFLVFLNFNLTAQSAFQIAYESLKDRGYYSALNELLNQREKFDSAESGYRSDYYQALSTYYSFVGNDTSALKMFDIAFQDFGKPKTEDQESLKKVKRTTILPENGEIFNAFDFIDSLITDQRLVIINESHHSPKHRILAKELLDELAKKGFNYLGLEALSPLDTILHERKYPVQLLTGFYTNEAVFGNLIRKGIALDFHVFSYDSQSLCNYDSEKPNYCKNLRELYQAKIIAGILQQDPNSRILIHCGYAHLHEKTDSDWIKMAEYVELLSGINPLTINQTDYTERGFIEFENPIYREASTLSKGMDPFVIKVQNSAWVPEKKEGFYDLQVFWPRLEYINGRPDYLTIQEDFKKYLLPKKYLIAGSLVQAFKKSEAENAVPIDQFIIGNVRKNYALFLPKGEYVVEISNNKGESTDSFELKI